MMTGVSHALMFLYFVSLPPPQVLENAPHLDALNYNRLAVIEITEKGMGGVVTGRVLWSNFAKISKTLQLSANASALSKLPVGRHALVPLKRVQDRWSLYRDNLTALTIRRTVKRLANLRELDRWRDAMSEAQGVPRLTAVVELVDSPLPLVSSAAQEYLVWQTRNRSLSTELIEMLGARLEQEQRDIEQNKTHLRFMERVGQQATADWLATGLFTKVPAYLRTQAVGILGRHPNPKTRKRLTECATDNRVGLSSLCRRWLGIGQSKAQ